MEDLISDKEKKAIEQLEKIMTLSDSVLVLTKNDNIPNLKIVLNLIQKQEKVIDYIDTYCRKELAFKRRLERDNRTPDLFNQGRFGTCENILEIINRKDKRR